MTNVTDAIRRPPGDFPYTAAELARIAAAVRNEGYPPEGRTGVGTVLKKGRA